MTERKYQVTGYLPSHKQHSLNPRLTPEQITAALGVQPKRSDPDNDYEGTGEKVSHEWEFFAQEGFVAEQTIACSVWDYKGSRWSAYGPRELFAELGLL